MWDYSKEVVVHVLDKWAEIIMQLYNLAIMKWVKRGNGFSAIFSAECNDHYGLMVVSSNHLCQSCYKYSEDLFRPGLSNWSGIDSRELVQTKIQCFSSQEVSSWCAERIE